jgi:hypothetical protein
MHSKPYIQLEVTTCIKNNMSSARKSEKFCKLDDTLAVIFMLRKLYKKNIPSTGHHLRHIAFDSTRYVLVMYEIHNHNLV